MIITGIRTEEPCFLNSFLIDEILPYFFNYFCLCNLSGGQILNSFFGKGKCFQRFFLPSQLTDYLIRKPEYEKCPWFNPIILFQFYDIRSGCYAFAILYFAQYCLINIQKCGNFP